VNNFSLKHDVTSDFKSAPYRTKLDGWVSIYQHSPIALTKARTLDGKSVSVLVLYLQHLTVPSQP